MTDIVLSKLVVHTMFSNLVLKHRNITKKSFSQLGFTLAELLTVLAVLGIIATFTIPKVLTSTRNAQWKAMAKESASMFSDAFQQYKLSQTVDAYTSGADIIAGINTFKRETTISVDGVPNFPAFPTYDCAASHIYCYRMHNGAVVVTDEQGFGEDNLPGFAANPNQFADWLLIDPDGKVTGNKDSTEFWLYANGKLRTWSTLDVNSRDGYDNVLNPDPTRDASWFSWQ